MVTDRKTEQAELDEDAYYEDSDDMSDEDYLGQNNSRIATAPYTLKSLNHFASSIRYNYLFDMGFNHSEATKKAICQCPCSKYQKIWREQFGIKYVHERDQCTYHKMVPVENLVQHLNTIASKGGYFHTLTLEYLKQLHPTVPRLFSHSYPNQGRNNNQMNSKSTKKNKLYAYFLRLQQYKNDRLRSSNNHNQYNDHNSPSKRLKNKNNSSSIVSSSVSKNNTTSTSSNTISVVLPPTKKNSFSSTDPITRKKDSLSCSTDLITNSSSEAKSNNSNSVVTSTKKKSSSTTNTIITSTGDEAKANNSNSVVTSTKKKSSSTTSNTINSTGGEAKANNSSSVVTSTKKKSTSYTLPMSKKKSLSSTNPIASTGDEAKTNNSSSVVEKDTKRTSISNNLYLKSASSKNNNSNSVVSAASSSNNNINSFVSAASSSNNNNSNSVVSAASSSNNNSNSVVSIRSYTWTTTRTNNIRHDGNITIVYRSNTKTNKTKSQRRNQSKKDVLFSNKNENQFFRFNPFRMSNKTLRILDIATGTEANKQPTKPMILFGVIRCTGCRRHPWKIRINHRCVDLLVNNDTIIDLYGRHLRNKNLFSLWIGRAKFTDPVTPRSNAYSEVTSTKSTNIADSNVTSSSTTPTNDVFQHSRGFTNADNSTSNVDSNDRLESKSVTENQDNSKKDLSDSIPTDNNGNKNQ